MGKFAIAANFFRQNGFDTRLFDQPEEVAPAFRERLATVRSVGFGGSATLRELALDAIVRESDAAFFDHWEEGLTEQDKSGAGAGRSVCHQCQRGDRRREALACRRCGKPNCG